MRIEEIQNRLIVMAGVITDQNRDRNGDFKLRDAAVVDDLVATVFELEAHRALRMRWMTGIDQRAIPPSMDGQLWHTPRRCEVVPVFDPPGLTPKEVAEEVWKQTRPASSSPHTAW